MCDYTLLIRCVEVILGMAVACCSLPYFLTVMKLLLFPVSPTSCISALPLLHKLANMRGDVFMVFSFSLFLCLPLIGVVWCVVVCGIGTTLRTESRDKSRRYRTL